MQPSFTYLIFSKNLIEEENGDFYVPALKVQPNFIWISVENYSPSKT